ncbi:hypothetical protein KCG44_07160 [Pacificimonas sp. WHA3]|uniref:Nutrient deprivation-induced protein n=1 Tax=Pacificimonas pallii TaxID=2827236 RepID=A0ABS6SFD1_9SPHN|nr:hypothetical protein [Pacificimonas pallii]MBV7256562.1 hypothetical protein [Pacificimonas pallii]
MANNIPGETVVTTPSAPMGAQTHPVIAEHQDEGTGNDGRRDRIKGEASRLAGEVGTKARGAAEEGKAKAAETIGSLAKSTRDAAKQFEGTQAAALTGYVETAADSIEKFGRTLDEKSVDELVDDVREMVRRSPAIAIGAAAAVGFMISRFMKATDRADDRSVTTQRYDA